MRVGRCTMTVAYCCFSLLKNPQPVRWHLCMVTACVVLVSVCCYLQNVACHEMETPEQAEEALWKCGAYGLIVCSPRVVVPTLWEWNGFPPDPAADQAAENLWFSKQTADCSCALQALLCVLLNAAAAVDDLGAALTRFRKATSNITSSFRIGEYIKTSTWMREAQETVGGRVRLHTPGQAGSPSQKRRQLYHFSALVVYRGPCADVPCVVGSWGCWGCRGGTSAVPRHPHLRTPHGQQRPGCAAHIGWLYELDGLEGRPVCLGVAMPSVINSGACTDPS